MTEIKLIIEVPGLIEAINGIKEVLKGKDFYLLHEQDINLNPVVSKPAQAPVSTPQNTIAPAYPQQPPANFTPAPYAAAAQASPAPIATYPAASGAPAAIAGQTPTGYPSNPSQAQYYPPSPAPINQTPVAAVPTTAPTYNIDDLARSASQLVDQGKREALIQTLGKYNVNNLNALPKEHYSAFAQDLRTLGAKI